MLGHAEIARLIPHDGAMVLLDEVREWSADSIICATRSHLRPDNPLRRGDRLAAVCGIEYGAQAMAVHGGLLDGEARPGVLASLRRVRLDAERLDDVDDELLVKAEMLHHESNGYVYAFSVGTRAVTLVGGQATVFVR